jgi:hypothetical protein
MRTLHVTIDKQHDARYKVAMYPDNPRGGATTPAFFEAEHALEQFLGTKLVGADGAERIDSLLCDLKEKGQASTLLD